MTAIPLQLPQNINYLVLTSKHSPPQWRWLCAGKSMDGLSPLIPLDSTPSKTDNFIHMTISNFISFIGLIALVAIGWALSTNRKRIDYRLVAIGIALQLLFALLIIGVPALGITGPLKFLFSYANDAVLAVLKFTEAGSKFVFGDLVDNSKYGFIFAFQVLPIIIFMSAMMAVFYHIGIMQKAVSFFAVIMQKLMNVSGAESLSTSANIFFGQTEAPLIIRPFIARMTNSELFCVMVGGMASTAGSVLAAYTGLLKDKIPDIAGHLITASVLSAPAALLFAKIMLPEEGTPETLGKVPDEYKKNKLDTNIIEAIARGAGEGLSLALNVAAMLIAFIAVIALCDSVFKWAGELIHFADWGTFLVPQQLLAADKPAELSLSLIFGWFFAPLAWLMGINWSDAPLAGVLLGQKVVLNEFVAYLNLTKIMSELSDRTVIILAYALCGFANFASIGIQIGGIGSMAPNRKSDLARLGIKSVIGGSLASFTTAAIAGMLI